ncbi:MAG TPA: DUF2779 domain-containing protein [Bacteroidales bacterium]|nr:DUF2779 domain-containing protein [Bacteroidales bacterium]
MEKPRYLTKSRFKLALECETKLLYTGKPEYPDKKVDDPFLESLAEGGFQVGELAKLYHPGGVMIEERDYARSLERTHELMNRDNVIIFEAAFRYGNLFIRTDILVKEGTRVDLLEVKAKSFSGNDSQDLTDTHGRIGKNWAPYLYDVAFQYYVLTSAFPQFDVRPYLVLADKNSITTVNGLNQKFHVVRDQSGRVKTVTSGDVTPPALGDEILVKVYIGDLVERILQGTDGAGLINQPFHEQVQFWADHYERDEKLRPAVGKKCRDCEFCCTDEERSRGKRDGFRECWKSALHFTDSDFDKPSVLDIWNYRAKDTRIGEGKYFMSDLKDHDFGNSAQSGNGMTMTDRQRIQVAKAVNNDNTMVLLKDELKAEMDTWKFPLHFIDFETSAVAIPFNQGMHPYETVAFQFSHHVVDSNGNIVHYGQYINAEPGRFPNFEFVRELKRQLEKDGGTIFRYAAHENSVLNAICRQLLGSWHGEGTPKNFDTDELLGFIMSITRSTQGQANAWQGERCMVDLCEMVKGYYYDPYTGGSNSIKQVLPAVLNRSQYLQEKYSEPIYGSPAIPSLNFRDQAWIRKENGQIVNPYKLLPPLFEGLDEERLNEFITDPELAEGGAAMMAYAKMQFTEMTDEERTHVTEGLLRYCELDTFAMVLIWEFWNQEINKS